MNNPNLMDHFARTEVSENDPTKAIIATPNIPRGVSDSARELFVHASYIAQGYRSEEWQANLAFLDEQIAQNPEAPALRVLKAATLQGMGDLSGASEQYKLAADMAGDRVEKAYLLELTAVSAGQAGKHEQMVNNAALATLAYLGK